MNDFRLWGRIEQIAPDQFVAIASAVPDQTRGETDAADVRLQLLSHRADAKTVLESLVKALGKAVTIRGDRVVDIEVDD
jgi:hypothetical protein